MITITIDLIDGGLSLPQHDFIDYLKNHKFRLFPRTIKVRAAHCLPNTYACVNSSLTTKYVITEKAKRAYCNGDEKLYSELSDF